MVLKPKKSIFFIIFCQFLPHKGNFCQKVPSKVIYTSYLKHQKYPFCAPIFHPLSETESYRSALSGKDFISQNNIRRHMKSHSGDNPYPCFLCQELMYINYQKLNMKIYSCENPYYCDLCGKQLIFRNNIKGYMNGHTRNCPYIYTLCAKNSPSGTTQGHTNSHTGINP